MLRFCAGRFNPHHFRQRCLHRGEISKVGAEDGSGLLRVEMPSAGFEATIQSLDHHQEMSGLDLIFHMRRDAGDSFAAFCGRIA